MTDRIFHSDPTEEFRLNLVKAEELMESIHSLLNDSKLKILDITMCLHRMEGIVREDDLDINSYYKQLEDISNMNSGTLEYIDSITLLLKFLNDRIDNVSLCKNTLN